MPPRRFLVLLSLGLALLLVPLPARAIHTGDILVADGWNGLLFVDAATGDQHYIAGEGGGHGFGDVTCSATGEIFTISGYAGVVYRIDPQAGTHTPLSTGGLLAYPRAIERAPDGSLYVVEGGVSGGVVRVHPVTGAQELVVSGRATALTISPAGVAHVTMADSLDPSKIYLYRLDLATGQKTRISNTAFWDPRALATDADGNIVLVDYGYNGVKRVYPAAGGAVAEVSLNGLFMTPYGATLEADGAIVVGDNQNLLSCTTPQYSTCRGALIRVDPVTGAQVMLSEQGMFHDVRGLDLYLGPNDETPVRGTSWGRLKSIYR